MFHKEDDPTHLRCVDNVDKGKNRSQDGVQEVTSDLSDRGQLICIEDEPKVLNKVSHPRTNSGKVFHPFPAHF